VKKFSKKVKKTRKSEKKMKNTTQGTPKI